MSQRIAAVLSVFEITRKLYHLNPKASIACLRHEAEKQVAREKKYSDYGTPQAHLVYKDTPHHLPLSKVDALIKNWLTNGSNDLRDFYLIAAQTEDDRNLIRDFFVPYSQPTNVLAEEIGDDKVYYEGAKQRITVNRYERDNKARKKCIKHFGAVCTICAVPFATIYGDIAKDVIHVHHLKRLSEVGEDYKIDPIRDLIPICPNCHTVIHLRQPPYSPEEVRAFMTRQRKASRHTKKDSSAF